MKLRTISLLAAAALLAACADKPVDNGNAGAGGVATQMPPPSHTMAAESGIVPGSKEDFQNVGDTVHFDFDKSSIREDGKAVLDKQVAWLKKYPNWALTVEGHCDERGTREYNLALGDRRATAVKKYLVAAGIADSRVKTISYGKERPVAPGSNEAAWAQNRRGVTVLGN